MEWVAYYDFLEIDNLMIQFDNINATGGIGNTFLFVSNMTNGDSIEITNSDFDSPYYEFIMYHITLSYLFLSETSISLSFSIEKHLKRISSFNIYT